jgi:hypothetical protein
MAGMKEQRAKRSFLVVVMVQGTLNFQILKNSNRTDNNNQQKQKQPTMGRDLDRCFLASCEIDI